MASGKMASASHEAPADTLMGTSQSTAVGTSPSDIDTGDSLTSMAVSIETAETPYSMSVCVITGHTLGLAESDHMDVLVTGRPKTVDAVVLSRSGAIADDMRAYTALLSGPMRLRAREQSCCGS